MVETILRLSWAYFLSIRKIKDTEVYHKQGSGRRNKGKTEDEGR